MLRSFRQMSRYLTHHEMKKSSVAMTSIRGKKKRARPADTFLDTIKPDDKGSSRLFKPVMVRTNPDDVDLGKEIAGDIDRSELLSRLNTFFKSEITRQLAREQGLDDYLYWQVCISFRKYCMDVSYLPPELYVLFSDILQDAIHIDSIFPYFLTHARRVFPHLECLDELKLISDLSNPANWYPQARSMTRRIIFHSGPTNRSSKPSTYSASFS